MEVPCNFGFHIILAMNSICIGMQEEKNEEALILRFLSLIWWKTFGHQSRTEWVKKKKKKKIRFMFLSGISEKTVVTKKKKMLLATGNSPV